MHLSALIPAALLFSPLVLGSPRGGYGSIEQRGTPDMTCGNTGAGANKGLSCASSAGNACCSVNGWCGDTTGHCGTGCQPQFGTCTGGTTTPPPATGGGGTSTLTCGNQGSGANGGLKCAGTLCCSTNGWCGNTAAYCGTGCQIGFGTCTAGGGTTTPPVTPPVTPPAGGGTSLTTCGNQASGANGGLSCANSLCCSTNGWCGNTAAYCGTGCQIGFGTCTAGGGTTTPPVTPPTTPPAGGGTSTLTCGNQGSGANGGLICAATLCCSTNGWCGNTAAYCGTGCQPGFGTCTTGGGGGTTPPAGGSTVNVPRTKVGSVSYGGLGVYDCITPGAVALTFDDGPFLYTSAFLDYLAAQNVVATFFVAGNNLDKGAIDDLTLPWAAIIRRMESNGHQIASHTWTHPDLSTLSETDRRNEMYRLETALVSLIGKFPTYMRPPYSSCTTDCQATMTALGYHVIYFDLDTDDYDNLDNIQPSKDRVTAAIAGGGSSFLSIAHDIHQITTTNLVPFMLTSLRNAGFRFVTLGDCLGDPRANWYRTP